MASNLRRSKRTVGKRISDLQSRVSYLQKRPAPRRIGNRVITGTQLVPGAVTRDELALPVTQTLDGKNSIYRQPTEPTGGTYVVGDCWYDTDDGYKLYIYTATSETTFAWVLSRDTGINEAQQTADGKNKVYRQISMPVGGVYAINDLWFDTDDGNKVYGWTGTAWVSLVDAGIAAGQAAANAAQVTADGRNRIYRQTTAPTGGVYVPGDLWFDIDDGNKVYGWTGTAWVSLVDAGIAAALAAGTAAQTTANGRNRIFRQPAAPTGETYAEGDLWFDTDDDNKFYRYVSGVWSGFSVGNNAIATLSADKLTVGTIDASVITVSNLDAGNISTGVLAAGIVNANTIATVQLNASNITTGTLNANVVTVSNLDAGNITAGTISSARITTASISAASINANNITTGTLNASVVTVSNLNAGNITTGTFTAGGVELGNDVGPGTGHTGLSLSGDNFNNIFLKRQSDGIIFFRINQGGTNSLLYDSSGGVLTITGTVNASAGVIGGWSIGSDQISSSYSFGSGKESSIVYLKKNGMIYTEYNYSGIATSYYEKVRINGYAEGNSFAIYVEGTASGSYSSRAYSSSGVQIPSDIRIKNVLDKEVDALGILNKVDTFAFTYKKDTANKEKYGFSAQQLYEHVQDAVIPSDEDPEKKPWTVASETLTPYTVKAIQQLTAKIQDLEERLIKHER